MNGISSSCSVWNLVHKKPKLDQQMQRQGHLVRLHLVPTCPAPDVPNVDEVDLSPCYVRARGQGTFLGISILWRA